MEEATLSEQQPDSDIIILIQDALQLASAACHFDRAQNFVLACDYYDKALLNIDEVLNKLPFQSAEWARLLEIRSDYDDRMEHLREAESLNFNILGGGTKVSTDNTTKRARMRFIDESRFNEAIAENLTFQAPSDAEHELPYWQLKNIKISISSGGFLTSSIFLPKKLWTQSGAKISGLSTKSAAFEFIINCISTSHLETLPQRVDESSMDLLEAALILIEEEFFMLQNQLSKSFSYIKAIPLVAAKDGADDEAYDNPPTPGSKSLASLVSSLGKNVKRYAEVGFSKLTLALPSKLSSGNLSDFTERVVQVCNKVEILGKWYMFLTNARDTNRRPVSANLSAVGSSSNGRDSAIREDVPPSPTPTAATGTSPVIPSQKVQVKLDTAIERLCNVSNMLSNTLLTILLKDIDELVSRYMNKMRKHFSTMHWDDGAEGQFEI